MVQHPEPVNRLCAVVGDSRSANNLDTPSPSIFRRNAGWQHWLGVMTGARCELEPSYQFATAGYTSEQVKPYASLAAQTKASIVFVFVGTNDRTNGLTFEETVRNLSYIRDTLLSAGKIVIFVGETPRGSDSFPIWRLSGQQLAWHLRTHRWLLDQDLAYPGVYAADAWGALASAGSSTGDCDDTCFQDGLHQGPEGAYHLAKALKPIVERLLPPLNLLSTSNADVWSLDNPGGNLCLNPELVGDGGTKFGTTSGLVANNVQVSSSPGSAAFFDIYSDPADGTLWQRLNLSGSPLDDNPLTNAILSLNGDVNSSDTLQGAVELVVDAPLENVRAIEVTLTATVGGKFYAAKEGAAVGKNRLPTRVFSGVYRTPKLSIPAIGTITKPSLYVQVTLIKGAAASGTLRWRRPTARKVSA